MASPPEILAAAFRRASTSLAQTLTPEQSVRVRVERIGQNESNGAIVRLILAATLAKAHKPDLDIRNPYTEIGGADSYSGRTYDEQYVTAFIFEHSLPCNPTTAFLTPALRNRNTTLLPDTNLVGRPAALYQDALQLLTDVQEATVSAADVLAETVRILLIKKNRRQEQLDALLEGLQISGEALPLSAEGIIRLVSQHLLSPHSSRLPVLVVAAAYQAASPLLGESIKPLQGHNAADSQTGAVGDVEIVLVDEARVVTGYEMKTRRVTRDDIDLALQKIADKGIHNYIFITTDVIEPMVQEYAASLYEQTGGIEIVVLDCLGFLRHFLHLFHRSRGQFLNAYQTLVLAEPESAVRLPLKTAWLALRQAAESALLNPAD